MNKKKKICVLKNINKKSLFVYQIMIIFVMPINHFHQRITKIACAFNLNGEKMYIKCIHLNI